MSLSKKEVYDINLNCLTYDSAYDVIENEYMNCSDSEVYDAIDKYYDSKDSGLVLSGSSKGLEFLVPTVKAYRKRFSND